MGRLDLLNPQRDEDRDRLRVISGAELETHNCSVTQCEHPARSNRGRYAYLCDKHKAEKVQAERQAAAETKNYEERVRQLLPLAKRLDRARRKAQPVLEELAAAKTAWIRGIEELPA